MVEFGKTTIKVFEDIVLKNKAYVDLILSDMFTHRTYSIGLVDPSGKVNFYDGTVRVVDPDGKEFCRYQPKDYLEHIAEAVLPYSYLKYPYLKKVGWKGLVDGADSGVYRATPMSRLNVSDGMATPAGPGRVREALLDADGGREREEAGPRHPGHPLGARRRAGLRLRGGPAAGAGRGDHVGQDPHPARAGSSARGWGSSRRRAAS